MKKRTGDKVALPMELCSELAGDEDWGKEAGQKKDKQTERELF